MKFVDLDGKPFHLPDPKAEATQELLGSVYDTLDEALDVLECVYQATHGPDFRHESTNPIRAVLEVVKAKVSAGKDKLHDTIAWAE